uniref:GDP-fucose protein O-fucosyltransferase 1 n=1 Tax=Ciona savignyi TaxID=51511 RepID=H2YJ27_CIOSA
MHLSICILPLLLRTLVFADGVEYDKNGYVIYCPCMGRFGNQVDHFLGSLSFARKLNRTLVVPPWITHKYGRYDGDSFPPYNHWFKVDTLKSYHRIIEMEDFMTNLAPSIWPPNKRKIYCHEIAFSRSDDKKSCPAKSGNPFGAFWDNFKVEFIASEGFPGNLNYHSPKTSWDHAYPSET